MYLHYYLPLTSAQSLTNCIFLRHNSICRIYTNYLYGYCVITTNAKLRTYVGKGLNGMAASKQTPFSEGFDSLDEIADRISEVLHCPITIEDANHRLLAYSTHDERT